MKKWEYSYCLNCTRKRRRGFLGRSSKETKAAEGRMAQTRYLPEVGPRFPKPVRERAIRDVESQPPTTMWEAIRLLYSIEGENVWSLAEISRDLLDPHG